MPAAAAPTHSDPLTRILDRRGQGDRPADARPPVAAPRVLGGAAVLGAVCGLSVSAAWSWADGAPSTPDQYQALGRAVFAFVLGVPSLVAVAIVGFHLLRVRGAMIAGPAALGAWFYGVGIVDRLFGLASPAPAAVFVAVPAVCFVTVAWLFAVNRSTAAIVVILVVVLAFSAVSQPIARRHRQDATEAAIRAVGPSRGDDRRRGLPTRERERHRALAPAPVRTGHRPRVPVRSTQRHAVFGSPGAGRDVPPPRVVLAAIGLCPIGGAVGASSV